MPLPRRWAGCRFGTTLPLEGATRGGLLLLAKCAPVTIVWRLTG